MLVMLLAFFVNFVGIGALTQVLTYKVIETLGQ